MTDRQSPYKAPERFDRDSLLKSIGEANAPEQAGNAAEARARTIAFRGDSATKGLPTTDIKSEATIQKDASGNYTQELHHKQHQFKLKFTRDAGNNLTEIHTVFDNGANGKPIKPEQVYKKDSNGQWFYHAPDGKKLAMQGDLRIDEKTGEFTQVLRRDIDKGANGTDGAAQESSRTMSLDGTDTIHRMDGSSSQFKYSVDGNGKAQASIWTERDAQGKETVFQRDQSKDNGQKKAWVSNTGDTRFDPKVQDNGNVTFTKAEDLDKNVTQVHTSAGDHIANGKEGVNYAFNYRGDVSSIQFSKPRLFEGHRVDRIDIGYRDGTNNQGQIIDQLTLYNTKQYRDQRGLAYPIQTITRAKDNNSDPTVAKDQWTAARGRSGPYALIGDYSIKDGEIATSEPLPKSEKELKAFIESNPNVGLAIADYQKNNGNKLPEYIKCTYNNIANTSDTNKPSDKEYSIEAQAGLDIPVPGESSYKYQASGRIVPPPPEPGIQAPPPSTAPGPFAPAKADDGPPPPPPPADEMLRSTPADRPADVPADGRTRQTASSPSEPVKDRFGNPVPTKEEWKRIVDDITRRAGRGIPGVDPSLSPSNPGNDQPARPEVPQPPKPAQDSTLKPSEDQKDIRERTKEADAEFARKKAEAEKAPLGSAYGLAQALTALEGQLGQSLEGTNDSQKQFLELKKSLSSDLAKIPPDMLESLGSSDFDALNKFLADRNYNIQLKPTGDKDVGVVTSLNLKGEWRGDDGFKVKSGDSEYPAFKLHTNEVYQVADHKYPVIKVHEDKASGLSVYATPYDQDTHQLDASQIASSLTPKDNDTKAPYNAVILPKVDMNRSVELGWLLGLHTADGHTVNQALAQTKIQMDQTGFEVKEAVAAGASKGIDRPFTVDKPFLFWVQKEGMRYPLFATRITQANWSDPRAK